MKDSKGYSINFPIQGANSEEVLKQWSESLKPLPMPPEWAGEYIEEGHVFGVFKGAIDVGESMVGSWEDSKFGVDLATPNTKDRDTVIIATPRGRNIIIIEGNPTNDGIIKYIMDNYDKVSIQDIQNIARLGGITFSHQIRSY